jgi:hypothetical protein
MCLACRLLKTFCQLGIHHIQNLLLHECFPDYRQALKVCTGIKMIPTNLSQSLLYRISLPVCSLNPNKLAY